MENGTATQDDIVSPPKPMARYQILTPRQKRFVEEYLIDLNATAAAKRAGYSPKWAYNVGPSVRRIPKVAEEIDRALAERTERTRITADRVVIELAKVAFGDPRRLFAQGQNGLLAEGKNGETVFDGAELTDAEAALISEITEIKTGKGGTRRIKLHCKMTALTALAKHLGLFNGQLEAPEHARNADIINGESSRERLARKIARLAASMEAEQNPEGSDGC